MVIVSTNPSLALCKYWGKKNIKKNLPATPSIAIGIGTLQSVAKLKENSKDGVYLHGEYKPKQTEFLKSLKKQLNIQNTFFRVDCSNNFPTASGLASSSSGYASITLAVGTWADVYDKVKLSSLSRLGSGSSARSIYGGWTNFENEYAIQIYDENYIPDISVLICIVSKKEKEISSTEAMKASKNSPFYTSWLKDSVILHKEMLDALKNKDFTKIGEITRLSYLRMHGVMTSCNPPIIYSQDKTLKIILECQKMRKEGIEVYETQDAGPQVKILCKDKDTDKVIERLCMISENVDIIKSKIASNPIINIEK